MKTESANKSARPDVTHRAELSARAKLTYEGLTRETADAWFSQLRRYGSPKDTRQPRAKPNAEQQRIIRRVIDRCSAELEEEGCQEPNTPHADYGVPSTSVYGSWCSVFPCECRIAGGSPSSALRHRQYAP